MDRGTGRRLGLVAAARAEGTGGQNATANTLRQGRKEVSGVLSVPESKCPGCVVSSEWTCPLSGLGDIHREHARRRRLRQNTLALMKREESKLLVTGLRVKDVLKGLKT